MYSKIVILKMEPDKINGGAETVVLGFFDRNGVLQIEIPRVSGKLFPSNIARGQSVVFVQTNSKPSVVVSE
jgi:hypothetical protein